jgi:hypothetical protein
MVPRGRSNWKHSSCQAIFIPQTLCFPEAYSDPRCQSVSVTNHTASGIPFVNWRVYSLIRTTNYGVESVTESSVLTYELPQTFFVPEHSLNARHSKSEYRRDAILPACIRCRSHAVIGEDDGYARGFNLTTN